jgi:hypothetical protein
MGHAHHIIDWAHGGGTCLPNLVLLCGHHPDPDTHHRAGSGTDHDASEAQPPYMILPLAGAHSQPMSVRRMRDSAAVPRAPPFMFGTA